MTLNMTIKHQMKLSMIALLSQVKQYFKKQERRIDKKRKK